MAPPFMRAARGPQFLPWHHSPRMSTNRAATIIALLLAAVAALRIADTWRRFSQTYDEPIHLVMGLEWLDRGTYRLEVQHPPLARIFDALAPAAAGLRFPRGARLENDLSVQQAGNDALNAPNKGDYARNLMLARLGALPFLVLGIFVVWAWTKRMAGPAAAAVAVFLYSTLPPILAHAGLATTDMAAGATIPAAIFAYTLWLEEPRWRNAALLALALAAALLSKFSAIPYCGLAMLLISIAWGARKPSGGLKPAAPRLVQVAVILAGVALLTWAAYRFTVWPEPIYDFPPPAILAALAARQDLGARILLPLLRLGPLPAPAFFMGLAHLAAHQAAGHASYLLGEVSTHGWWYFFPVAVAVKTPLPFLLITIPAAVWMRRQPPALAAAAVMLVAIAARIDIGVRHVLPLYAPLAVCGGAAVERLWRSSQRGVRALVAILLAWQLASSALAHPDYLAWFNELAGGRPDRILVDSNLDWGQDLPRLRDAVRENQIRFLWIAYFGSTDLARYPLGTTIRQLPRGQRVHGWIAVSRTLLAGVYKGEAYAWLRSETPAAEVGKSMLLYYVR
jgi:hypothetical protein